MALTTNYSWDKPVPGGDVGAWGTKLNTLFDAVDATVKLRQTEAATAQTAADLAKTENLTFPPIAGGDGIGTLPAASYQQTPPHGKTLFASGASDVDLLLPIRGLAVGMRITGFTSFGQLATGVNSPTVALISYSKAAGLTVISAGHALAAGLAQRTTSGLTHDVVADTLYFFRVRMSGAGSPTGTDEIQWVQPVVIRFP